MVIIESIIFLGKTVTEEAEIIKCKSAKTIKINFFQ